MVHGKRRQVSKFEAALTQLVDKAAEGDLRAFRDFIRLHSNLAQKKLRQKREVIVETIEHSDLQKEGQIGMSGQASEHAVHNGKPDRATPLQAGPIRQ